MANSALALYPERPCCKFGSRRQWLDGNEGAGKVMEHQEEPWAREERCSPCQTNFVVTLMMRKSDSDSTDEDYVPKHSRSEERSSSKDDKPKRRRASKNPPKGNGLRGLVEEDNNPNWKKMASSSISAQKLEPKSRNVDNDARDKNNSRMAVPALGGRINRRSVAVPEGAEMHSIRTLRGEGAFIIKRGRIQSFAAPSDGVIYGDAGEKIDGYMSVEEKVYSYTQPKTLWRRKKSTVIGGIEEWSKWNHNVYECETGEGPKHKDAGVGNYIEAKGTQPKGWPTVEIRRFFNERRFT